MMRLNADKRVWQLSHHVSILVVWRPPATSTGPLPCCSVNQACVLVDSEGGSHNDQWLKVVAVNNVKSLRLVATQQAMRTVKSTDTRRRAQQLYVVDVEYVTHL
jgi:hypothetical protein